MSGLGEQPIGNGGVAGNLTPLDGLTSLLAVVNVSVEGPDQKKCRQYLLELPKHSAWRLFFESACFKHKPAIVVKAQ